jgi:PIN domain nuclease of toxin-antitoxin system
MAGEQDRIGEKTKLAIVENDVLVSAVVIWEIAIKRQLGKLDAPPDLLDQLEDAAVRTLPITPRHADRVGTLPPHHRDPFDCLLVAQAICDELALATTDSDLHLYGVETAW